MDGSGAAVAPTVPVPPGVGGGGMTTVGVTDPLKSSEVAEVIAKERPVVVVSDPSVGESAVTSPPVASKVKSGGTLNVYVAKGDFEGDEAVVSVMVSQSVPRLCCQIPSRASVGFTNTPMSSSVTVSAIPLSSVVLKVAGISPVQ